MFGLEFLVRILWIVIDFLMIYCFRVLDRDFPLCLVVSYHLVISETFDGSFKIFLVIAALSGSL